MSTRVRAENGKFAIYTVSDPASTDNAPLQYPLSNASRVKFHSDLDYPQIVDVRTGSVTIPGASPGTYGLNDLSHTVLFAHGRGAAPMVLAEFTAIGVHNLPAHACGSVPTVSGFNYSSGEQYYDINNPVVRWLSFGANASDIVVTHYCGSGFSQLPPLTISYKVWVTDFSVDGASPPTYDSAAPLLGLNAFSARFGKGRFDSTRRYVRTGAPSPETVVPQASPLAMRHERYPPNNSENPTVQYLDYRYDGYVLRPGVVSTGGTLASVIPVLGETYFSETRPNPTSIPISI
jgi:hypothetical protein